METVEGTVAVVVFVLAVLVLAATVPLWVPRLLRAFRRGVAVADFLLSDEADKLEQMLTRQREDWRIQVQRSAARRGLPATQLPALSMAMDRWWLHYVEGRISYHAALCEAESWISRRVRLAEAAAQSVEGEAADLRGAA